jgi:hypothetical protein
MGGFGSVIDDEEQMSRDKRSKKIRLALFREPTIRLLNRS